MTLKRVVLLAIALGLVCAAALVLYRIAQTITLAQLDAAMRGTSIGSIAACLLSTAVSFAALGYYDRFGTRVVVPGRVPRGLAFRVGAIAHAVSNTLGFHVITGGALRYRLYGEVGLTTVDIARVTAIVGLCVGLGTVAMLALALMFTPATFAWGRTAGVACLAALTLVFAFFPALTRTLRLRRVDLPPLSRGALATPLCIGLSEAAAAIAGFYVLLPGDIAHGFAGVAALYLAAALLGVLSHAPGGVGVFEATMLAAFPPARHAEVLGALLLYRLLYNLLPFGIAVIALGLTPALRWRGRARSIGRRV